MCVKCAELVNGSSLRGCQAAARSAGSATSGYLDELGVFEQEALDVQRVIDLGDRVLGITTIRAKLPDGPSVEWVWCQLVTFRDGLVTEVRNFLDRESALVAAGLSE